MDSQYIKPVLIPIPKYIFRLKTYLIFPIQINPLLIRIIYFDDYY